MGASRLIIMRAFTALAIAVLLLNVPAAYLSGALEEAVVARAEIQDNVLTLSSYLYEVRIDLESGEIIFAEVRSVDGGARTVLDAEAGVKAFLLAVGEDLGEPIGGWDASVVREQGSYAQAELYTTYEGLDFRLVLKAYSYKPVVDFSLSIYNGSDAEVQLSSAIGGPAIVLGASVEEGSSINVAYGPGDDGLFESVFGASDRIEGSEPVESVIVTTEYQGERRLILGFTGLAGSTGFLVDPAYTPPGSEEVSQLVIAAAVGDSSFAPGEDFSTSGSLVLGVFNAYNAISSGVVEELENIYPDIDDSASLGFAFDTEIPRLESRIETLTNSLENLREENESLQRKVDELTGADEYWKSRLSEVEEELAFYKVRAERNALLAVLALLAGIVVGGGAAYTLISSRSR